jgi:hypothetical protein
MHGSKKYVLYGETQTKPTVVVDIKALLDSVSFESQRGIPLCIARRHSIIIHNALADRHAIGKA